MRAFMLIPIAMAATTYEARADDEPALPLQVCWAPATAPGPNLDLRADGTFTFQGSSGNFMTQGAEIWLLGNGEPRMGTKWRFALDSTSLTLSKPEDFKYLGGSDYLYLELTPTDTVWRFSPAPSDETEACQRAAAVSPPPPG